MLNMEIVVTPEKQREYERAENLKPRLTKDEENRHRKFIKQLGDHSMWSEILKA